MNLVAPQSGQILFHDIDILDPKQFRANKAYLQTVMRDGAEKASYVAEKTLRKVYKKVGFVAK